MILRPKRVGEAVAHEAMAEAAPKKRGRPRKHPVRVKRPRGRPPGPASLRKDPERYTVAYLIARWALTPTTPRIELARDIAQLNNACENSSRAGAEVFAAALAEGRKVRLKAKPGTPTSVDDPTDAKWRNKDWANAQAEKLWRKTDRLLSNLPDPSADDASSDQKDARWLRLMVDAWLIAFDVCQGTLPALGLDDARALAAEAGEAAYFDAVGHQSASKRGAAVSDRPSAKPNGSAETARNRPTIRVVRGELGRIVDEIEDALIKARPWPLPA